jgi:hypothetical protein
VADDASDDVSGDVSGDASGAVSADSSADGSSARVRLVGRQGCHLCDDARKVVEAVTAELGEGFDERDIDHDPELHAKYWDQIPVVLVDGRQVAFWTVDADRLRAALQGRGRGWRRRRLTS